MIADVTVEMFDVLGRRIGTVADAVFSPGRHTIKIDGRAMAAGIYVYRMRSNDYVSSRKMLLLK